MLYVFPFAFLAAFLLSSAGCFAVRHCAPKIGLVDNPGERKIHSTPFPTGGGLGVAFGVLGFFAAAQLFLFLILQFGLFRSVIPDALSVHLSGIWYRSGQLWTLLGLGSVLLILGTLDDRFNLNWKIRLAVQFLVATAAVCCGWKLTLFADVPVLTGILSVLWITGLVNSFNMLDNMNGLSAGTAAVCTAFLTVVMFLAPNPASGQPQFFIAGLLFVLLGSISGFLMYNNPFRASMFMGDGGAYFIGFLLATSTLSATFSGETTPQTLYVPLLILAVPVYDTVSVVCIRLLNGKSPFTGDKNHFSHRLVNMGFSKTNAVLLVYLTTAVTCCGALLLYRTDFAGATLVFGQTVLVILLIACIEYTARNKR
ncbi:MAG: undecaprenyl/decaprenyl-phosphate alpha-N-acetylglucosaminyl 1-phosphate transferase [Planctomycetaceae bacterium]|jgi:UDP-GlcNAc:undecaprenyl-phosphate GlcNAc-1-phosphate transferase|nr:undecaprenyl/decaprenyl-phosphate alpha-N-acetylglucosaminyl 1-phosphate transferase [Planctomycetaceae bacterium]